MRCLPRWRCCQQAEERPPTTRGDARLDAGVAGRRRASSRLARGDRCGVDLRPQAGCATAVGPACSVECARARDLRLRLSGCCGSWELRVAPRLLEGLNLPLCTRSLSRVLCIGRLSRVVPVLRTCSGVRGRIRNVVFSHLSAALLVRPTWCRLSRCDTHTSLPRSRLPSVLPTIYGLCHAPCPCPCLVCSLLWLRDT